MLYNPYPVSYNMKNNIIELKENELVIIISLLLRRKKMLFGFKNL
jgi:hypothetical protein